MASLRLLLVVSLLACNRGPDLPERSAEESASAMTESAMEAASADPHAGLGMRQQEAAGMGAPRAPQLDPNAPALAGMRWTAPAAFTYRAPTRPMRNAEYVVAGEGGEAVMTVFHFPGMGGDVQDNVRRWVGQFRNGEGEPAEGDVSRREVGGLEVHVVDVAGTYSAGMMGGGAPQAGQRLLGAIVVAPEGPVFFKLVGPDATVAAARDAFDAFVASFEA